MIYQFVATALISALVAAVGMFKVEEWRHASKEADRVQAQLSQERLAAAEALQKSNAVVKAQNAANQRVAAARRDVADSYARQLGLHDDLAAAKLLLSTAPADAVRKYASTAGSVVDECSKRYSEMEATAKGLASDSLMYQQAWPK